ncbi:phage tail assembly chaperone G [Oceanobacillus jeddahense]|uniref:phage tail assembly chaperone G n=1 Tax=Oceanobacillus jeddahense TaxID=1462527 RepID=UPI000595EDCD|nr:hypothetical protein [Oceanobacillus jeddahense]
MKYYDTQTRSLTLVTDVKGGELETKTYSFPFFVEGIYTKKSIDLGAELEEKQFTIDADLFERITTFVVGLYGNQFTSNDLVKGIDSRHIVDAYIAVLFGTLQGDTSKKE